MMPGWRVHKYVDVVFFGKSYSKIHRKMDEPVLFLGKRHRVLFHDAPAAALIAKQSYPDDPHAIEAAYLHILTDQLCTADLAYKKFLTTLALLNRPKKRRKMKKTKEKEDPLFKRFMSDAKKLEELRRMFRTFYSRLR
jgi:hypothetical protein